MNFVDSNIYLAEKPVKNTTVNNISLKEMFKVVQNNEAHKKHQIVKLGKQ